MDNYCSRNLRLLLCSKFLPKCNGKRAPKPPCESTCLAAKAKCAEPLQQMFNLNWDDEFPCEVRLVGKILFTFTFLSHSFTKKSSSLLPSSLTVSQKKNPHHLELQYSHIIYNSQFIFTLQPRNNMMHVPCSSIFFFLHSLILLPFRSSPLFHLRIPSSPILPHRFFLSILLVRVPMIFLSPIPSVQANSKN